MGRTNNLATSDHNVSLFKESAQRDFQKPFLRLIISLAKTEAKDHHLKKSSLLIYQMINFVYILSVCSRNTLVVFFLQAALQIRLKKDNYPDIVTSKKHQYRIILSISYPQKNSK